MPINRSISEIFFYEFLNLISFLHWVENLLNDVTFKLFLSENGKVNFRWFRKTFQSTFNRKVCFDVVAAKRSLHLKQRYLGSLVLTCVDVCQRLLELTVCRRVCVLIVLQYLNFLLSSWKVTFQETTRAKTTFLRALELECFDVSLAKFQYF